MRILTSFLLIGLVYYIQRHLYEKYWDYRLKVTLSFEDSFVPEGQKTYLIECVENNKFLPIPLLRVKFSASRYFLFGKENNATVTDQYYRHNVYSVIPYQKITRKYPLLCSKRGCYSIHRIDLISRDLFLSGILANQIPCESMIHVLPGTVSSLHYPQDLLSTLQSIIHKAALTEDPFELKSIRDYEPYDNMRHINWKQTARSGYLKVNTHFPTTQQNVSIYLNLDPNIVSHQEDLLEESIRIAFTLATRLNEANVPVQFVCNGKDIFTNQSIRMEAGSGRHYLSQLGVTLARIDLKKSVDNFTSTLEQFLLQNQMSHQLILISNYRKPDLLEVYHNLMDRGYPCFYIIPMLKSTEVLEAPIPNTMIWEVDYLETTLSETP